MNKQLELFPEPTPVIVRCPECKYTADHIYIGEIKVSFALVDLTTDEQLDAFEELGCDDGEIMCPRCAAQFPWPPTEQT